MSKKTMSLTYLNVNKDAKIVRIEGGHGFQNKLRIMGIREGQKIKIISKQPFHGPVTIALNGCQMSLGRGMAHRIVVEEL